MLKRVLPIFFLLSLLLLPGCSSYTQEDIDQAWQAGYDEVVQDGKNAVPEDADACYDRGYEEGYQQGCSDTYDTAYQDFLDEYGSYDEGYADGKAASISSGSASNATAPSSATSSSSSDSGVTVYVTATGAKYHRDGCNSLWNSQIPKSLSEAKNQGYTPCSRCNPPE